MVLVALKCPHCGGDIQLDDAHEFGFCLYCGTKIIVRDEVVNQTNNFHADVRNVYNGQTTVTNNYSVKPTSGQCIYPILSEGHYEGPMVEGKPHGKGVYFWPGGVRYEGEFVEGRIEGFGKKVYGEAYYEAISVTTSATVTGGWSTTTAWSSRGSSWTTDSRGRSG